MFSLGDEGVVYSSQVIGLIIYIVVFAIAVPILMLKHGLWQYLEVYMPNLDFVAFILGYRGGPLNSEIFRYLYNPTSVTLYGTVSTNIINFFALLGVTYLIARYTVRGGSLVSGWSRAFFMLPITYLFPGHLVVEGMNAVGAKLAPTIPSTSPLHWPIMMCVGLSLALPFFIVEKWLIDSFAPTLAGVITRASKALGGVPDSP